MEIPRFPRDAQFCPLAPLEQNWQLYTVDGGCGFVIILVVSSWIGGMYCAVISRFLQEGDVYCMSASKSARGLASHVEVYKTGS